MTAWERINEWLQGIYGPIGEPEPIPDSKILGMVRELLTIRISAYCKMVDTYQDFPVDREAYNLVAHELMMVRAQRRAKRMNGGQS